MPKFSKARVIEVINQKYDPLIESVQKDVDYFTDKNGEREAALAQWRKDAADDMRRVAQNIENGVTTPDESRRYEVPRFRMHTTRDFGSRYYDTGTAKGYKDRLVSSKQDSLNFVNALITTKADDGTEVVNLTNAEAKRVGLTLPDLLS